MVTWSGIPSLKPFFKALKVSLSLAPVIFIILFHSSSLVFKICLASLEAFKKCRFFLATGKNEDEQKILMEILNTKFREKCVALDNLSIKETLPIIKNCNVAICNDTSFSHLSSALGIKTITLMADTPLIYGSYNTNMHPIIPDGETTVSHNTHGKDKINPDKIYEKLLSIIN